MDANKLFQGFCENILKPIIQEAVSEALPPHLETATSAKKYYTVQQAAEIANVDISTIYRWKGKGTLTFLYIEGRTLISAEEFDAKIDAASADYQELTRLLGEKEDAEMVLMDLMEQWEAAQE